MVSKRMVQILELLNEEYHEYTTDEKLELGRKLKSFKQSITLISAKLGKIRDGLSIEEKLKVTYKDIENEIKLRNSLSLKRIILVCEGLLDKYHSFFERNQYGNAVKDDKEYYADPLRNPSFRSYMSYRFRVSLVEVIAGKLFPKGRSWRNHVRSQHFDGYEESFKKTKSLQASYSRTMSNLVSKGLVNRFTREHNQKEARFYITHEGIELLAILTANRIDND